MLIADVQDAFRSLMKVGAMAVPCAFLLDGSGTIVWRQVVPLMLRKPVECCIDSHNSHTVRRQAYSAGYPFATMGFYSQLLKLLAGEPLDSHGNNPNPEEELEGVEEAQDVFATQEVPDAVW